MRTYYIYKATNKLNNKSYIGKTTQFRERVWQHMRCYEKEDCTFHQAIQEYGVDNFEWEILQTTESEKEADASEKKYIEEYNTYRDGYNMNKGGVGGHNARAVVALTLDGEYVRRYDSAMQAEVLDGYCNSDVLLSCKEANKRCRDRIFMFEDEYEMYGARHYEKPKSHSAKNIVQCDDGGNEIARYESVKEASEKTGILRTRISSALIGAAKHAGGYIFVYAEDFPISDLEKYKVRKKGRKVAQVDPETNEILRVFDRVSEAGEYLGKSYKVIHKVIDTDRKAYGFRWISQ